MNKKSILTPFVRSLNTKAIITRASKGPNVDWKYEDVQCRTELKDNEILVDMTSTGICHSDIFVSQLTTSPRVLGHEGTAIVKKVGSKVTNCNPGDPVLLSYNSCGHCKNCEHDLPSFCAEFNDINTNGADETFKQGDTVISGSFFGQSSFAKNSVVSDKCVVNLKPFNLTQEQIYHLGPLGCGFQTGCGAMINAAGASKGESAAVYGLGGVGFGAIMGAKNVGCKTIIALDIFEDKLKIAKELGATHTILNKDPEETKKQILEITNGEGVQNSVECIGGPRFVQQAISNAATLGKIAYVGASMEEIKIPSYDFMMHGKKLIGSIEGNSSSQILVPKMINWFLEGKFPVDKLEKLYKVEDFEQALADMKAGTVTKAVLVYK